MTKKQTTVDGAPPPATIDYSQLQPLSIAYTQTTKPKPYALHGQFRDPFGRIVTCARCKRFGDESFKKAHSSWCPYGNTKGDLQEAKRRHADNQFQKSTQFSSVPKGDTKAASFFQPRKKPPPDNTGMTPSHQIGNVVQSTVLLSAESTVAQLGVNLDRQIGNDTQLTVVSSESSQGCTVIQLTVDQDANSGDNTKEMQAAVPPQERRIINPYAKTSKDKPITTRESEKPSALTVLDVATPSVSSVSDCHSVSATIPDNNSVTLAALTSSDVPKFGGVSLEPASSSPLDHNVASISAPLPSVLTDTNGLPLMDARSLQFAVSQRLQKHMKHHKNFPPPVFAVVELIVKHLPVCKSGTNRFTNTKESVGNNAKIQWIESIFARGQFTFTIPAAHRGPGFVPDPNYHAIEGVTIVLPRWELACQDVKLCCPECEGELVHERFNLTQASPIRLCTLSGERVYVLSYKYKCNKCNTFHNSTDGSVIQSLPFWLQQAYPVDARYAKKGSIQIHKDVSRAFERLCVTYLNGEALSRRLREAQSERYIDAELCYYSQRDGCTESPPYPSFEEWSVDAPTGERLRDALCEALYSDRTISGISIHDRCMREIQGVSSSFKIVHDHHFQVLHTYNSDVSQRAAGAWTAMTESGEVCCVALVPSTKTRDLAHAAEQLARRANFHPKAMWTDTWPNNEGFWKLLFPNITGFLGLFHWLQRIVSTLRDRHFQYHEALSDLRSCIYVWNSEDYDAVVLALQKGTLGGGTHTPSEILELERNGKFKSRYASMLRKSFKKPATAQINLRNWFDKYKGQKDPKTGLTLFTADTKNAFENALVSIQHVLPDGKFSHEELYETERVPKRSKSGLPRYRSLQGESTLEAFHSPLQHYGNCGMNTELADAVIMLGIQSFNAGQRRKREVNELPEEQYELIPSHLRSVPTFSNESDLFVVNAMAQKANVIGGDPHTNITRLQPDNGERFLSQYLAAQEERNKSVQPHLLNDRCMCDFCGMCVSAIGGKRVVFDEVSIDISQDSPCNAAAVCGLSDVDSSHIEMGQTETDQTSLSQSQIEQELNPIESRQLRPWVQVMYPTTQPKTIAPRPFVVTQTVPTFPHATYHTPAHVPNSLQQNGYYAMPNTAQTATYQPLFGYGAVTLAADMRNTKSQQESYCCVRFMEYDVRKRLAAGEKKRGQPPHDEDCPKRKSKTARIV